MSYIQTQPVQSGVFLPDCLFASWQEYIPDPILVQRHDRSIPFFVDKVCSKPMPVRMRTGLKILSCLVNSFFKVHNAIQNLFLL